MNTSTQRIIAAATLVLIAPFARIERADAAVGRTAGTFAVSPTGAATYTIPLFAPRGPGGLQPNIALTYSSQSGMGYLGVGWHLSGLSAISRCNQTYAQDGAPAAVSLATGDGYCLDGQRLRLTSSGDYGQDGSTYQTEVANFSLVTAHGTVGNGPAYFTVQGRDGRTYEYGNGGNSQVLFNGTAAVWWLDKVTDRAGNTMAVAYCAATPNCPNAADLQGMTLPATISWTPSSYGASVYNYTMQFSYEGMTLPPTAGYAAGSVVLSYYLLNDIQIQYAGATVKNYLLSYVASPTTQRETLTSIMECADAGATNCLPSTTIAYQNGEQGVGSAATLISSSGSDGVPYTAYDLNGDGINDLTWYNGNTGTWWVAFGTATGYANPFDTGLTFIGDNAVIERIDGSSSDSFLFPNSGSWYYYKWNGLSFIGTTTGVAIAGSSQQETYALADVNGDGLPDLITTGADGYFYVQLNTTQNGVVSFSSSAIRTIPATGLISSGYGGARRLDFSGSGRQDLLLFVRTRTQLHNYVMHFNGTTFVSTYIDDSPGLTNVNVDMVDFNDDGCTDILQITALVISACNGNPAQILSLPGTAVAAIDWNNDHREDILVAGGSTLSVYTSTGVGFSSTPISTSIPYGPVSNSYYYKVAHNATGDGQDALLLLTNSSPLPIQYYLHNGARQPPDILASITDGYGNSAAPSYVSISQSVNGTYFPWNDAQYPYQNYLGPMYVVANTNFSDPSNPGGSYLIWDYYAGASMNLQGRGFAGFGTHQTYDTRNSVYETFGYGRAFPYTGLLTSDYTTQSNNPSETIFYRTMTAAYMTLAGTDCLSTTPDTSRRCFLYVSNENRNDYEVGGPKAWQLITTTSTSYSFDNYGNATNTTTTVTDEDSGSPYYGGTWTTSTTNNPDVDTSNWCLTLSTEMQVAYSSSVDGSAVTRTKQFAPDTANCRYTQIVTEPSSSYYKVTETPGYDSFGNVDSDTVTGINMSARVMTANWGATGQFPVYITDPSDATTQFNYDFRYGLLSSKIDPNNLTTSWQYGDGFGRETQENRPDGTYTTWAYDDCSNAGGCPLGSHTLVVTQSVHNTNGSILTDGKIFFDQLERSVVTTKRMLVAGAYDRNEVRYDSLGRIVQRAFPCTWISVATTCPYWSTTSYDILNRIMRSQRPISSTNNSLQTTSYQYLGRTTIVTDPQGNTKTTISDVNGRLRQTKDAYGYAVTLGYDSVGSETSVTDSLSNMLWSGSYAYGLAAYLTGENDMDRGVWNYTVDALGERTAWTDAKGQSFAGTYDSLSRMLTRSEPDMFTQWTWGASAANHNYGKLASVCTGYTSTNGPRATSCTPNAYSETDTYDSAGRLFQRMTFSAGPANDTYTWQYDPTTGLLDTLTYPTINPTHNAPYALELAYGYQNGILRSIADVSDSPNVAVWQASATNPAGQITQETLGNGIVLNRSYDAVTRWLNSIQAGVGGGGSVENLSFLYDYVGNVVQRQDNNRGLTENAYYDNDYRIDHTTLTVNGTTTPTLQMCYDTMGNITWRSDMANSSPPWSCTNPANVSWTYDPVHKHAVTQAGSAAYQYSYDANGNMITRLGGTVSWTSSNYPMSFSSSSSPEFDGFEYGPDRQMYLWFYTNALIPAQANGIYRGDLLEEVQQINDYTGHMYDRHYIYAGGEPVAIYSLSDTGTKTFDYVLSDHQGSVATLTDSTAAAVVNESFTPFGSRRDPNSWQGAASSADLNASFAVTSRAYTFQTQVGVTLGLNHLNGRVQDPVLGRFLSPDPFIPDPTDAQSYNRYSYTENNPLTYTDPSGFNACIPGNAEVVWVGETVTDLPPGPDGQSIQQVTSTYTTVPGPPICFSDPNFAPVPVPSTPGGTPGWSPPSGAPAMTPHRGSGQNGRPGRGSDNSAAQADQCTLVAPTGQYRTASGVDARFNSATAGMLSTALANLNQQGIVPVITSGYRSSVLQGSLATSNSPYVITPAQVSWHEVGAAVDFGPNSNAGYFTAIQAALTEIGFVWGGSFRTPDLPHFQSQPAGTSPSPALVSSCARAASGG